MPTIDDVLVVNLEDALEQAQRYLLFGIVSAALFVVLSTRAPELIAQKGQVDVPTVGKVGPGTAAAIFFLAYLIFPVIASLAIERVRRIASTITDPRIVQAALTRFSIVTLDNRLIRMGSALGAPFLMLVGYLLEQARGAARLDALTFISGFAIISTPYLFLAYRLLRPFGRLANDSS